MTHPTHSKRIDQFTKAELLALLDDLDDWQGKDSARAAVENAATDAGAQSLFLIAVYLPHGQAIVNLGGDA